MISIDENIGAAANAAAPRRVGPSTGHLAEQSPLRKVFPDGRVPLVRAFPELVTIGPLHRRVYLLALERLTTAQFNGVALLLHSRCQETLNHVLEAMVEDGAVPISQHHIEFVALPSEVLT